MWVAEVMESRRQAALECASCPRLTECGDYALDKREDWGIWGGMDFSDKDALEQKPPRPEWLKELSEDVIRRAHAAYAAGNRTEDVVMGEREYNRRRQAEVRAKRRAA